jgi:hypothetical protein
VKGTKYDKFLIQLAWRRRLPPTKMGKGLVFARPKFISFLVSVGIKWCVALWKHLICALCIPLRSETSNQDTTANPIDALQYASTSFVCIHKRLYIALLDEKQAQIVARNILNTNYIVVPLTISKVDSMSGIDDTPEKTNSVRPDMTTAFIPPCIGDIFKFHEVLSTLERKYPRKKLVFQTGADHAIQTRMVFLLGCHMIMSHGLCFEKTCTAFDDLRALIKETAPVSAVSIRSCWRAICCAKRMQWIDFERGIHADPNEDRCIHIDEYMHYARYSPRPPVLLNSFKFSFTIRGGVPT